MGRPDMAAKPPTFGGPRRSLPTTKNGAGIAPGPVMQSREGCLFVVGAGLDLDGLELELAATPLQAVLATHAGLNFRERTQPSGSDLLVTLHARSVLAVIQAVEGGGDAVDPLHQQ